MKKIDSTSFAKSINLPKEKLMEFALETSFVKRKRLIKASDFLYSVCTEAAYGIASYNDIAANMEVDCGISVSRQAIWKKVTESCEDFFKKILAVIISNKINKGETEIIKAKNQFKRILVQDSTIIKLPSRLFPDFSGVANGQSQVCNARVQCVYDLISEQFISFSIDPYSKNDLKAASEISLEKNDLVLRDRGYLINDEIQRHVDHNAHCIYRYRFNMILKDPKTENPVDIFAILKKEKHLDRKIMLNNQAKTIVRILGIPIPKEIADNRRMRAKKEMKRTPSKELLQSFSWSIIITTITDESSDYSYLVKVYSLRWRIEVIFKCWKSNIGFDKIHNVSNIQLKVWLFARFIMIIICAQLIFRPCRLIIKEHYIRNLSMLKLTKYLLRNPERIMCIMEEINQCKKKFGVGILALVRFCTYDKRKRLNFQQKMEEFFP